ncbi:MAG: IclR family transcriptional regulator [Geminicoccaceae bacterium]
MATTLEATRSREDRGAGTLTKGLALLEAVAAGPQPLRFTDLLHSQPYPKATLHRLLKTLIEAGMVVYDGDQRTYHPGVRLIRLSHAAWLRSSLADAARDALDALSNEIDETIHLAVLDDAQVLYLDKRAAGQPVTMFSSPGKVGPAHCTGVGKAMLAFLDEDSLEDALARQSFHRYMPSTLTTPEALKAELEEIRKDGYGFDREEHEVSIICVAAPILSARGGVLGGLSVTSTTYVNDLDNLAAYAPRLKAAAAAIADEATVRMLPGT